MFIGRKRGKKKSPLEEAVALEQDSAAKVEAVKKAKYEAQIAALAEGLGDDWPAIYKELQKEKGWGKGKKADYPDDDKILEDLNSVANSMPNNLVKSELQEIAESWSILTAEWRKAMDSFNHRLDGAVPPTPIALQCCVLKTRECEIDEEALKNWISMRNAVLTAVRVSKKKRNVATNTVPQKLVKKQGDPNNLVEYLQKALVAAKKQATAKADKNGAVKQYSLTLEEELDALPETSTQRSTVGRPRLGTAANGLREGDPELKGLPDEIAEMRKLLTGPGVQRSQRLGTIVTGCESILTNFLRNLYIHSNKGERITPELIRKSVQMATQELEKFQTLLIEKTTGKLPPHIENGRDQALALVSQFIQARATLMSPRLSRADLGENAQKMADEVANYLKHRLQEQNEWDLLAEKVQEKRASTRSQTSETRDSPSSDSIPTHELVEPGQFAKPPKPEKDSGADVSSGLMDEYNAIIDFLEKSASSKTTGPNALYEEPQDSLKPQIKLRLTEIKTIIEKAMMAFGAALHRGQGDPTAEVVGVTRREMQALFDGGIKRQLADKRFQEYSQTQEAVRMALSGLDPNNWIPENAKTKDVNGRKILGRTQIPGFSLTDSLAFAEKYQARHGLPEVDPETRKPSEQYFLISNKLGQFLHADNPSSPQLTAALSEIQRQVDRYMLECIKKLNRGYDGNPAENGIVGADHSTLDRCKAAWFEGPGKLREKLAEAVGIAREHGDPVPSVLMIQEIILKLPDTMKFDERKDGTYDPELGQVFTKAQQDHVIKTVKKHTTDRGKLLAKRAEGDVASEAIHAGGNATFTQHKNMLRSDGVAPTEAQKEQLLERARQERQGSGAVRMTRRGTSDS